MGRNVEMGQTGYCIRMQTEDGAAYWQTGNESSKDKEPSLNIGEPLVMSPDHFQLGTAIVVMEPNGGIADAHAAGLVGEAGQAGPSPYRCTRCDRLEDAESFIRSEGYRRCDSVACNCGGWHFAKCNPEVADPSKAERSRRPLTNILADLLHLQSRLNSWDDIKQAARELNETGECHDPAGGRNADFIAAVLENYPDLMDAIGVMRSGLRAIHARDNYSRGCSLESQTGDPVSYGEALERCDVSEYARRVLEGIGAL